MTKGPELLKELENEFNNIKKDLKFKASFEEIDKVFYLKDQILKEGFVSPNLSRQITWRIVDTYTSWYNYLHNLIMPNPQSMVQLQESQGFNDEEKEKIMKVMPKLVLFGRNLGEQTTEIHWRKARPLATQNLKKSRALDRIFC